MAESILRVLPVLTLTPVTRNGQRHHSAQEHAKQDRRTPEEWVNRCVLGQRR